MNQIKKLSIKVIGFIFLTSFINVQAESIVKKENTPIQTSYLESKDELKDYILDTGDSLYIEFINLPDLSGDFTIDSQGEIYFKRIKETYVRGLSIKELKHLLEERYTEFLYDPEIYIRITRFKPIKVAVRGEVRRPGLVYFKGFTPSNEYILENSRKQKSTELELNFDLDRSLIEKNTSSKNEGRIMERTIAGSTVSTDETTTEIENTNEDEFATKISNAIIRAGGLTSYSDISQIEIIRNVPINNGGGKKKAIFNLTSYLKYSDTDMDIRLFDGDIIYIPKLKTPDPSLLPSSIVAGLTPSFISVTVTGRIENSGQVKIPNEGSLSDVMNLAGPRKPLSGKVYLIRYKRDGTLLRKEIKYSSTAEPGSDRNPYLISGDFISVKNSVLGRTAGVIRDVTAPFIGIKATKDLVEDF